MNHKYTQIKPDAPLDSGSKVINDVCLVLPWYVFLRGKVKFSLFELWIFAMQCGFSAAPIVAMGIQNSVAPIEILMSIYIIAHAHAAVFTSVVDTLHWDERMDYTVSVHRLFYILVIAAPLNGISLLIYSLHR
ncbi:MAG TPA: hypothetical protein VEK08_07240 [Planctomycetota bacterium]|nr:hypothetical protein [Planctomycetota bacterium]